MRDIVPDDPHPDAMECPMCDNITLIPAEDEHSTMWSCTHCGAEVQFCKGSAIALWGALVRSSKMWSVTRFILIVVFVAALTVNAFLSALLIY
jgi:hypothetical protein